MSSSIRSPHSTALHATLDGRSYLTGPLAGIRSTPRNCRRSPARQRLRPAWARRAATRSAASWYEPSRPSTRSTRRCGSSPSTSDLSRPSSTCRRSRGLATASARRPRAAVPPYELDASGLIESADIVPPTSQNQAAIEDDLRSVGRGQPASRRRRAHRPVRADDPQLRPVHLLLRPLPRSAGRTPVTAARAGRDRHRQQLPPRRRHRPRACHRDRAGMPGGGDAHCVRRRAQPVAGCLVRRTTRGGGRRGAVRRAGTRPDPSHRPGHGDSRTARCQRADRSSQHARPGHPGCYPACPSAGPSTPAACRHGRGSRQHRLRN